MLRRFSISFAISSMLLDLMIVALSFYVMTLTRPYLNAFPGISEVGSSNSIPSILFFLLPVVWVIIFSNFSIYDGKKNLRIVDEFGAITIGSIIAGISQAGILFLTFREVSRILFLSSVLLSFTLCIIWRLIVRIIFRLGKDQPSISKRVLFVGEQKSIQKIINQIERQKFENIIIKKSIPLDMSNKSCLSEGVNEMVTYLQDKQQETITDLVISLPHHKFDSLGELLNPVEGMAINIWVAMDFIDLSLTDAKVENFSGIPVLDLRAPALSESDLFIKRGFDLVFTSLSLIVALPMMLIVGTVIILLDGFPVFFHQDRVGENGRLFKIHKFRTMVINSVATTGFLDDNGNQIHKIRNDPRITKLGRFLRRFSLDEIPQLFNVLAGEMSIVGPRPELPAIVEKYERWQRKRLSVPPGITGWWQVTGRSDKLMHLHTEDDIYYVLNYSIWLDIRIIIRTVWVVLIGLGSF